jgi:nucleoside-diphosphate-sugar epimerase
VRPPRRSVPRRVATAAAAAEAAWRALPLPGRPPLTRLAVWLSGLEVTIDTSRARTELGYAPVRTVDEGLAQLADEARRGRER